jgi:hypothetical protein
VNRQSFIERGEPRCSFCHEPPRDRTELVGGPTVFACRACVSDKEAKPRGGVVVGRTDNVWDIRTRWRL